MRKLEASVREAAKEMALPGSVFVVFDEHNRPIQIVPLPKSRSVYYDSYRSYDVNKDTRELIRKVAKRYGRGKDIPPMRMERWDFRDGMKIPLKWGGNLTKYYKEKLMPAARKQGAVSGGEISLRDAVFVLHSGLPLLDPTTDHAHLSRRKDYKDFVRDCERGAWQTYMQNQQKKYTAVQTDAGVLIFSRTKAGNKAMNTYLQDCADRFFDPTHSTETLRIYELTNLPKEIESKVDNYIDRLSVRDERSDKPQLFYSRYGDDDKLLPASVLEGATCIEKYDMRPDFQNIYRFTQDNPVKLDNKNYSIAMLLDIAENGYSEPSSLRSLHTFEYEKEFETLAKKITDARQAKADNPASAHDFGYGALQKEAREMARDILVADFNIRNGAFYLGQRQAPIVPLGVVQEPDVSRKRAIPAPDDAGNERQKTSAVKHVKPAIRRIPAPDSHKIS